jgi:hypothetical protein
VSTEETREATPEGRRLSLVCSQPGALSLQLPLNEADTVVFGRGGDDGVGVTIDDARVSRRHAQVRRAGGFVCVTDLASRNGTVICGETVRGAERRIGPGDVFDVGPMHVIVAASLQGPDPCVVADPVMRKLHAAAVRLSRRDATVLLVGEPGVGKRSLAQRMHASSPRAGGPFVAVQPGAGPAEAMDVHAKLALGGTLFVGGIETLSPRAQATLLAIANGARGDVRLLGSSARDLRVDVAAGGFDPRLHARLATVTLAIPALRERRQEIPVIAQHFLHTIAAGLVIEAPQLTPEASRALVEHPWPRNLTDLMDVMEYAIAMADGGRVLAEDLPPSFRGCALAVGSPLVAPDGRVLRLRRDGTSLSLPLGATISLERRGALKRIILHLARQRDGTAPRAAHSVDDLFAVGWPGERAVRGSADGRVRTAVWMLRKLGLGELLSTSDEGYSLDAGVTIAWE